MPDSAAWIDHSGLGGLVEQRALADEGLDAAGASAQALLGGIADRKVPDFSGAAVRSAHDLAIGDDCGADAAADRKDDEVAVVPAAAEQLLGDRECLDVVLDEDGQVEGFPQLSAEFESVPVEHGRVDPAAVRGIDDAGDADP